MVMLPRLSLQWRGKGHQKVTGGQFNGGRIVKRRENGYVTEVACLMEREWSCYGGGQFNGGIMIMWSVLWRESGRYGGHQFKGMRMVMLQRLSL